MLLLLQEQTQEHKEKVVKGEKGMVTPRSVAPPLLLSKFPAKGNKMFKFHLWDDLEWSESGIKFLWRRVDVWVAILRQIMYDKIKKCRITRGGPTIYNESQLACRMYFSEELRYEVKVKGCWALSLKSSVIKFKKSVCSGFGKNGSVHFQFIENESACKNNKSTLYFNVKCSFQPSKTSNIA